MSDALKLLRQLKNARQTGSCYHELGTTDFLPRHFWREVDIALGDAVRTWRDDPATEAQRRALKTQFVEGMTKGEASDAIDASKARAADRVRERAEREFIGDYPNDIDDGGL